MLKCYDNEFLARILHEKLSLEGRVRRQGMSNDRVPRTHECQC